MHADDPIYFTSPEEWRAWLQANHATQTELWVGYHKTHTQRPSLTWAQAVREALCFGWIDGQVGRVDDDRHRQRFTPRKPRSRWSAVNVGLVAELEAAGLMQAAGRRAFAARDPDAVPYSTSDRPARLAEPYGARLREHPEAAAFFDAQPASYRKTVAFWISDAKREETRDKRLAVLLAACARGERLGRFVSPSRRRA
ncbi:MAG: YdeI/OmpD-associated family protein [Solirubrobacteraceae bacterium]